MTKKTVSLSLGERLQAIATLNQFKGNVDAQAYVFDDSKGLSITEDEFKAADMVKTPSDEDFAKLSAEEQKTTNRNLVWNDEKAIKDVELHQSTIDFIVAFVKEKNDIGVDFASIKLASLYKKLIA